VEIWEVHKSPIVLGIEGLHRHPTVVLTLLFAIYLALILPTVGRQGINWDERTDLTIAEVYTSSATGLLYGTRDDALNTRLPMYSVAFVFRATGGPSLYIARLVSCAVGGLTIIAVFLFCRRELDQTKALVAAAILATSPYFLYFSATAFTEGDVFVACAVAWFLVAGSLLREKGGAGRAAIVGVTLGLALSAKISTAALMPALVAVWLVSKREKRPSPTTQTEGLRQAWVPIAAAILSLGWLVFSAWSVKSSYNQWEKEMDTVTSFPILRLVLVACLWMASLVWSYANRDAALSKWTQLTLVLLVAGLSFFVLPPVHTTNPWIAGSLWKNLFGAGEGLDLGFAVEAALLHFAVIVFKPSVVIGAAMWAALVVAVARLKTREELRLPVLSLLFYLGFMVTLPWAQTHYMMGIFPIFAILAADLWVEVFRRWRAVAVAIGIVVIGMLAVDFKLCYPDLNLNGYQWLGERYIGGRSSLGYRCIARVGSDGAEQILRWADEHVSAGETVAMYIYPQHIIRKTLPQPRFHLVDGIRGTALLEEADYVLTTLNADIRAGYGSDNPEGEIRQYRYDREKLEEDFERVFSIKRAFDLEVATVWRRKDSG
jgi:hypothetical protein